MPQTNRSMQKKIRSLRWVVVIFLVALFIPAVVLVMHAYSQLKWETFFQYSRQAQEFSNRINLELLTFIENEESRRFADFQFLVVSGDPAAAYLQRSPLSELPDTDLSPGLLGYFQVDADGVAHSPLLPDNPAEALKYGLTPPDIAQRKVIVADLISVLQDNRLVKKRPGKTRITESIVGRAATESVAADDASDEALSSVAPEFAYDAGNFYEKNQISEPKTADRPRASMPQMLDLADSEKIAEEREAQVPEKSKSGFQRLAEAPAEAKKSKESLNTLGKVKDLPIALNYQQSAAPVASEKQASGILFPAIQAKRETRKEQSVIQQTSEPPADERALPTQQISLFESDIEPYGFSLLDSGHFVLYRQVWSQGKRYVQGALFDQQAFLQRHIVDSYTTTELSGIAHLVMAYQDDVLLNLQAARYRYFRDNESQMRGELLHRANLLAPFGNLEMIFTVSQLPVSETVSVINYTAFIYLMILCVGSFVLYRLGLRQIRLGQQQQDFVSAVSHELKTPLTAIRMYGEILKAGWASDDKKKEYYNFIYDESERLSRLINNVLQLARFNKNELQATLQPRTVRELVDLINAKILYQCEATGFAVKLEVDPALRNREVKVDEDFFQQIMINLVDNAIKFSAKAARKEIEIGVSREAGRLEIFVRDYGPGIPKSQLGKIFRLFYRVESELTRETVGTGIGLALVDQLAKAMGAKVDVINCEVGAKFILVLEVVS